MSAPIRVPRLGDDPAAPFPPTSEAFDHPNGLLAGGGDLSPQRLLSAYRQGIFPWYSENSPLLWWSPAPRCVLYPQEVYLSQRTRRRYNTGRYRLTLDRAFPDVIHACAGPREYDDGTWITPDMERAYIRLHRLGQAHSLEVWLGEELAGGIYGLALGAMFFGESMFGRHTDCSKIALVALCRLLCRHGFGLLDCQVGNPHLFTMGARELSREDFEGELHRLTAQADRFGRALENPGFEERW